MEHYGDGYVAGSDDLLVTARESAGMLDISPHTVVQLAKAGYLTPAQRGQHWYVTVRSVLAYRRLRGSSARSLRRTSAGSDVRRRAF
ncbi:helix-turn-helix domain-containing protein [Streptomyces sp. NPDC101227]|uniref:helix-turn-helix domain-containing protein n=1 Tax=Streptomyces sp. NPDC101227 TaxID=3366136 RepID=UPI0038055B86